MNKAKLITASGHRWAGGLNYGVDRAAIVFLGKSVQVSTSDGSKVEPVEAVEMYNETGNMIGMIGRSPSVYSVDIETIVSENVKLKARIIELEEEVEEMHYELITEHERACFLEA